MNWPLELTFRAFAGTMVCTMLAHLLFATAGQDIKHFILYDWNPSQEPWGWFDVPWFLVLASILGPFSALHTKAALWVGAARQRAHAAVPAWTSLQLPCLDHALPVAKMVEAVLFAVVTVV